MQQLEVQLSVAIPEHLVLVERIEYQRLQEEELVGCYWSMKDLEKRIGYGSEWIQTNILYQPHFKRVLDVQNGGCVYYPAGKGNKWVFQASGMSKFLEKNFHSIFKK